MRYYLWSMSSDKLIPKFLYANDEDAYKRLSEALNSYENWVLIYDEHTKVHCRDAFIDRLGKEPYLEIETRSGELNKDMKACTEIWMTMMNMGVNRNSIVLNLGGGLLCDLGGFAAATYKRGLDFINVPTTLLAMVDASFGGKTGVNLDGVKNQIGVFESAQMVLIDPAFLETLPKIQFKSGMAEVIKHGLIDDAAMFNDMEKVQDLNELNLDQAIRSSNEVKSRIVQNDPRERGERKKLNFGHTIGHAIESIKLKDEKVEHGIAVAAGMLIETKISRSMDLIPHEEADRISSFIDKHYERIEIIDQEFRSIMELILFDKKNDERGVNFTLLKGIGDAIINQQVDNAVIESALKSYLS